MAQDGPILVPEGPETDPNVAHDGPTGPLDGLRVGSTCTAHTSDCPYASKHVIPEPARMQRDRMLWESAAVRSAESDVLRIQAQKELACSRDGGMREAIE